MIINIIVAMTKERVIGKDGAEPWGNIREDMKLFRDLTTNNIVIMGRKTWLSIPQRFRPLPDRTNIVVSGTLGAQSGAIVCKTLDKALEIASNRGKEIYCIGGGQLYSAMMPLARVLHISWIKKDYEGDTNFPEINFADWKEEETKEFEEFTYKRYTRN
jgi:dihydrofolate reductase